eukprot:TRINITY_DN23422_c0_g3_i1.p1 TRINITY_DN23422_c0_g3~~TRINITY_DN23422_c0_g3_i1.p1  ORF type:complete len:1001 (-),score=152.17 TRINITY_DN23422_c0_g3_i1:239-3241(-)
MAPLATGFCQGMPPISGCYLAKCIDAQAREQMCKECYGGFTLSPDGTTCSLDAEGRFLVVIEVILFVLIALIVGSAVYKCIVDVRQDVEKGDDIFEDARSGLLSRETTFGAAIRAGARQYRISLMGDWSIPMKRYLNYSVFVDVSMKDIVGVGLSSFYHFHSLPMFAAIVAQLVAAYASHFSGYEKSIVEAVKDDFLGDKAAAVQESSRAFAELLWQGLGVLFVTMLAHAWFFAWAQSGLESWFNKENHSIRDYAIELKGLPKNRTSETALLEEVTSIFSQCGVKPLGVSIGYDLTSDPLVKLSDEGHGVWNMMERIIVKCDTSFDEPADGRFGIGTPKFGYNAHLADPADLLSESEEMEHCKAILDVLECSGKAWVVFKTKTDVNKVLGMFNGFWVKDEAPINDENRDQWLQMLQPDGLTEVELTDLGLVWPHGEGVVCWDGEISGRKVRAGTIVEDPQQKEAALGANSISTDGSAKWCHNLRDVQSQSMTIQRRVKVKACPSEPLSVQWYSLGTSDSVIVIRTFRAVAITFLVFIAIVLVVYMPYSYWILAPYAAVNASPTAATSQIMGFLIGIANSILCAVMGMQAWGIGFSNKWALDVWVLVFNMCVSMFNTVFNLVFAFRHDIDTLAKDYLHLEGNYTREALRSAVAHEIESSQFLFNMMVPGWLFSGFIIGNIVGLIVPWIQNYLLLQIVFSLRCLPLWLARVITLLIPYNPDPASDLHARQAEYIFAPGEISLAWDYGDKIVTPTICLLTFFFLSPQMWRIFVWLLIWANFMYLFHRYYHLQTCKKQLHDSGTPGKTALILWFLPISTVAAAWMFWAVRLGIQTSYMLVPVAFVASAVMYWMGLAIIFPFGEWTSIEKERMYESVASRCLFTWFNANPIHVLKSRYGGADAVPTETKAPIPFQFGKEYLIIGETSTEAEQREANAYSKQDNMHLRFAEFWEALQKGNLNMMQMALFAKRSFFTYFTVISLLLILACVFQYVSFANEDISAVAR